MKAQIDVEHNIAKNFKVKEFLCPVSSMFCMEAELIFKLQKLRDILGRPIIINSAYRTKEYNSKVGGAPKSQHMFGRAVDIKKFKGISDEAFAQLAEYAGFDGIGLYDTFYHIDTRGYRSRWDMRTKQK